MSCILCVFLELDHFQLRVPLFICHTFANGFRFPARKTAVHYVHFPNTGEKCTSAELGVFFPSLVYGVVENKGGEKGSHCVESLVKSQKLRKQGRGKRLKGKKAPNSADNN